MAKTPKSVTIADSVYEFYPLAPEVSVKLLTRLTKLLGEPLVRTLAGVMSAGVAGDGKPDSDAGVIKRLANSKEGSEAIASAVTSLASKLDEDEVLKTIKELIEPALLKRPGDAGTRRINFDADFAGHIGELLLATRAAIEAEYGNFFDVFESTISG